MEKNSNNLAILILYLEIVLSAKNVTSIGATAFLFANVVLIFLLLLQFHLPEVQKSFLRILLRTLQVSFPVGVLVFLVFHYFPRSHFLNENRTQEYSTGFRSNEFSPGEIDRLQTSPVKAFSAQFDGELSGLYWKGNIFWNNEGFNWNKRGLVPVELFASAIQNSLELPADYLKEESLGSGSQLFQVWMEPRFGTSLFVPQNTFNLSAKTGRSPLPSSRLPGDIFELFLKADNPIVVSGTFLKQRNPNLLTKKENKIYLQVPPEILNRKQLTNLARSLKGNPEDILSFFENNNFLYSLSPGFYEPLDLHGFLFERKVGFCEHYAAVTANLFRIAGVPARVVVGFYGGHRNPLSRIVTVRESDAHAWVEYYSHKDGKWETLDVTQVLRNNRAQNSIEASIFLTAKDLLKDFVSVIEAPYFLLTIFSWNVQFWFEKLGNETSEFIEESSFFLLMIGSVLALFLCFRIVFSQNSKTKLIKKVTEIFVANEKTFRFAADSEVSLKPSKKEWLECLFSKKHPSFYRVIVFYIIAVLPRIKDQLKTKLLKKEVGSMSS